MKDHEIANLVVCAARMRGQTLEEFLRNVDALEDVSDSERERRRQLYMTFLTENLEAA
jgi:hypothetical protein